MKTRAKNVYEIINFLKKNGYNSSSSYGRNSGSAYVQRSTGFTVSQNKKYAIYNNEVIIYYRIKIFNLDIDEIVDILKDKFIILSAKWSEIVVAGEKIRDYK